MILNKEFGERLARLRTIKGVSAREMSLALGQSAGYINNIENSKNYPSMAVFMEICEYLEISPKDFFDTEYDPSKPQAENIEAHSEGPIISEDAMNSLLDFFKKIKNDS